MVPDQKQVLDKSLFPAFYFSNSSTLHKATMQQLLFGSSSWPLPPDYIPWSQQFIIYTYISTEFLKLVLDTIVLIMEKAMGGLQEIPVATRQENGVLFFPSRRGLTLRVDK